jgi:hypothetical protein
LTKIQEGVNADYGQDGTSIQLHILPGASGDTINPSTELLTLLPIIKVTLLALDTAPGQEQSSLLGMAKNWMM